MMIAEVMMMQYQLTGSVSLSKNTRPRSTRVEALRVNEETGRPYRDYAHHIDPERTPWNKVLVNRNVRDVYQEQFGAAIEEYNAKQIAKGYSGRCKTVDGYIQQIVDGEKAGNANKRPRLWNDFTAQCGSMLTNPAWDVRNGRKIQPMLAQVTNEVYEEFKEEFEKKFPNLVITCAVIHNDESTPHMQVQYIPVCHHNKRGLSTQVKLIDALAESLDAIGVKYNRKRDDGVKHAFNAVLENMLEDIMRKHGIERIPGEEKKDKHLESVPVAELRKRSRILREQVKRLMDEGKNPLDAIKTKSLPLLGTFYSEKDIRGLVETLRKENALLRFQTQIEEQIDKKNAIVLQEQKKRQQLEIDKERLAIEQQKKETEDALHDVLMLKEKLKDKDEQQKYKLLSKEVNEERKALKEIMDESKEVLRTAKRDAIAIRDDARKDAEQIVSDARAAVDAMYEAYESSKAGRKKKDEIKLRLLKEQYPDIDGRVDSAAGHEMLKRKVKARNAGNVLER